MRQIKPCSTGVSPLKTYPPRRPPGRGAAFAAQGWLPDATGDCGSPSQHAPAATITKPQLQRRTVHTRPGGGKESRGAGGGVQQGGTGTEQEGAGGGAAAAGKRAGRGKGKGSTAELTAKEEGKDKGKGRARVSF